MEKYGECHFLSSITFEALNQILKTIIILNLPTLDQQVLLITCFNHIYPH